MFGMSIRIHMIRAGIYGASAATRKHIEQLLSDSRFTITGISGIPEENAAALAGDYDLPFFADEARLVEQSDLIDITCCNASALQLALFAVRNFRYVFLDGTIDWNPEDIRALLKLAREAGVRVGVRHLKRQRKVFQNAKKYIRQPQLIEMQVSVQDSPSCEVPLYNVLFQSVDLLALLNPSHVKKMFAKAISMGDGSVGAVDATVHFDNGTVGHVVFNRLLAKETDTVQVFSPEGALKIDFLNNLAGFLPYRSSSRYTIPSLETTAEPVSETLYHLMANHPHGELTLLEEIYPSAVLARQILSMIYQQVS